MDRREFLKLSGAVTVWPLAEKFFFWPSIKISAVDRLAKWAPDPTFLTFLIEWRYVAGRIVDDDQDFGFIVSISRILSVESQQFLVQRQDFTGDEGFVGNVYEGELTYIPSSATYVFQDQTAQELIRWQWDETAQTYNLTITTPELTLENAVLIPQGPLIPEGGDGNISVGRITGISLDSEYHADWTKIEINDQEKGTARVDMQGLQFASTGNDRQGLRPSLSGLSELAKFNQWLEQGRYGRYIEQRKACSTETVEGANTEQDYDHRWFVIAVDLNNGSPAWVSAWKIEDQDGPFWCVTIALGSGETWQVFSLTEEDESSLAAPLEVTTLAWQSLPPEAESDQSTGAKWRLTAGKNQPNDLIDLTVTVPPGQFGTSPKLIVATWVEEAVGTEVEGTILDSPISSVKMIAAESSTEFYLNFLPLVLK